MVFDDLYEPGYRDRFGYIALAAALPDLFLVALHCERGDRDDRDAAEFLVCLQLFGDLQSRHLGQLNIHQDQVRPVRSGDAQRLAPVLCLKCRVAVRFEKIVEELHVQLVVLNDQYLARCARVDDAALHHASKLLLGPELLRAARSECPGLAPMRYAAIGLTSGKRWGRGARFRRRGEAAKLTRDDTNG